MATVLHGGIVVSSYGEYRADVRIEGERVVSIGMDETRPGDDIVDVGGACLLPGGVDVHTHFDLPAGEGVRSADCFATGTRAAIAGGTTTIIDYATQFHGETLKEGLANWQALANGKCRCDYGFHMAISEWNDSIRRELPEMIAQGITSFKAYMAYKDALQLPDGSIYEILRDLSAIGGLLCVHCENGDLISSRVSSLLASGIRSAAGHSLSRPAELETEAAGRLTVMARLAAAPVYVVHVSAAETMRGLARARMNGVRVYAETCPQYIFLDDERYGDEDAAKYVCSPPLRDKSNHAGLWSAIDSGIVDTVATDHCPFDYSLKRERGRQGFHRIPNGMPGVEHRMSLMWGAAESGAISRARAVQVTAANPAGIFGLYPRKGVIAPGSDADIVVFDPGGSTRISARTQFQNVDYTPYEGFCTRGRILSVYLRGKRVFDDGKFLTDEPAGMYVGRGASGLRG